MRERKKVSELPGNWYLCTKQVPTNMDGLLSLRSTNVGAQGVRVRVYGFQSVDVIHLKRKLLSRKVKETNQNWLVD